MNPTLEWLGFLGISMSMLAYLPQIIHLIKEHCSAGISPGAYYLWIASSLLLLSYALAKHDLVFIRLQIYQTAASVLVLYFGLKYRNQLCEDHGGETLAVRLAR